MASPPAPSRRRAALALAAAVCLAVGLRASGADDGPAPSPSPPVAPAAPSPDPTRVPAGAAATDAFFARGEIPTFRLELAVSERERLRAAPRTYVRARVREGDGTVHEDVGVKLKGGAGSFRELDDRPAFTLNADRFEDGRAIHGMSKLHLDNSVQDDSYLHEALCAELFEAAGLVAPRVTHARVWLDGRDLGVYVLKEGVDRRFLARHFPKARGNLYDGGFCQDVDEELEKDAGKGPDDRSDLAALVAACREPDLLVRATRVPAVLDVERFLTFTALERMTNHWDGYSTNRNNYRLYFEPPSGRAVFLPHGMDQMFGDPEASVLDAPVALVASAVLEVPVWRKAYRARLVTLLPLFDAKTSLVPRVRRIAARLAPVIAAISADAAAAHAELVRDLEERLVAREKSLREQVTRDDPPSLEFDKRGQAALVGWRPKVDDGEPTLEQTTHAGRRVFAIAAGRDGCVASWRRGVTLTTGRYTLRAQVATKGVAPRLDPQGSGAGLRISGDARAGGVSGASPWRAVAFDFEVKETLRHVELVAELRAEKGEAYFDVESFRLVRRTP